MTTSILDHIKILGRIDLDALQEFYEWLIDEYPTTNFSDGGLWEDGERERHDRLFAPYGKVTRCWSWFSAEVTKGTFWSNALRWHQDGWGLSNCVSLAYPSPTQFFLGEMDITTSLDEIQDGGLIYMPEVGEIVQADLTKVWHRTNPDSYGKPRLLLRVEIDLNEAG